MTTIDCSVEGCTDHSAHAHVSVHVDAAADCSLEGCCDRRPHHHIGDDELVRTGPYVPLDPPSGSLTPPRMAAPAYPAPGSKVTATQIPVRARGGRLVPPNDGIAPRPFFLLRFTDVSGVSGEGVVAYGVRFASGKVALEWCVPGLPSSVGVWDCLEDVLQIHGHGNNTVVRWLDGGND